MNNTHKRGFGSMDRAKQREIASKGGRAAHKAGTAHEWTTDEAIAAGRKGGQASQGGRGKARIKTAAQDAETRGVVEDLATEGQ